MIEGEAMLRIESTLFDMAFRRDIEYHTPNYGEWYLDLKTGNVFWVYDVDQEAESDGLSAEENKSQREDVESQPDQFALIPGLHHGEYHDILKSFITSDCIEDKQLIEEVQFCYQGSIGRWIERVGRLDDSSIILNKWSEFQESTIEAKAREFLKKFNIEYEFY